MIPFELSFPTRILFGEGELAKIGQEALKLGQKALLVTGGKSAKATGILDKAIASLQQVNLPYVLFDRIEPNPRTTTVDAGAAMARENHCDFIIALGGGSVMDAAKAIAAAALSNRPIYDYMRGNPANLWRELLPIKEALPLMCIPTVAATGSEANHGSVLTHWESHEKSSINGPGMIPKVAILDPTLTYTVPPHITAEASADIFSHLFESYLISNSTSHVQDGFSESLIRNVVHFAPIAMRQPDHAEARATLLWASTLAISAFTRAGRGIAGYPLHQVEHTLSGYYDIAHGRGLAILAIPYFQQIILQDRPERLARMGRECFGVTETDDIAAAQATIPAVQAWFAQLGITQRLADFSIPREVLPDLAAEAVRIGGNGSGYILGSRQLKTEDVLAIYEACY